MVDHGGHCQTPVKDQQDDLENVNAQVNGSTSVNVSSPYYVL